jgi:chromosome segregation ATPase
MLKKSVIILVVTVFALIVSGCASQEDAYVEEEYGQHLDTLEEDMITMGSAIEKWNAALAMAESDEYINDEESSHLTDVANEYVTEMNRVTPHMDSFKAFIEENEIALKDMGVDTYEDKKTLDDFQTKLDETYDSLKESIANTGTNYIAEEYEQHIITFEKDIDDINDAHVNWDDTVEMANSDGYISAEEYNNLEDIGNDYIYEMNRITPHLESFREFIEENEIALKDMQVDTYENKKLINDLQTSMAQNYEVIIISIEG